MTPRLTGLPYEVLSSIVEGISFEDTVNLAHSSKELQFLEREDKICRKVLEVRRAAFTHSLNTAHQCYISRARFC